jgi:hypothetical protein
MDGYAVFRKQQLRGSLFSSPFGLMRLAITVHMPGGMLHITIDPDGMIHMTGPVARVCSGKIEIEGMDEAKIGPK